MKVNDLLSLIPCVCFFSETQIIFASYYCNVVIHPNSLKIPYKTF